VSAHAVAPASCVRAGAFALSTASECGNIQKQWLQGTQPVGLAVEQLCIYRGPVSASLQQIPGATRVSACSQLQHGPGCCSPINSRAWRQQLMPPRRATADSDAESVWASRNTTRCSGLWPCAAGRPAADGYGAGGGGGARGVAPRPRVGQALAAGALPAGGPGRRPQVGLHEGDTPQFGSILESEMSSAAAGALPAGGPGRRLQVGLHKCSKHFMCYLLVFTGHWCAASWRPGTTPAGGSNLNPEP
jgi:hypothetical protein